MSRPIVRALLCSLLLAVTGPAIADEATAAFAEGRTAFDREDYSAAVSHWERAAALGHAEAEFRLGALYEEGRGVEPSPVRAVEWYRRAAEHGSERAQFNLAHMYASGRGVEQDEAQAALWYRRAAERGNAHAQYTLGLMYARGSGVEHDPASAYAWLTVAVHNFNPNLFRDNANEVRGQLEEEMSEAERRRAQDLLDEWESARY